MFRPYAIALTLIVLTGVVVVTGHAQRPPVDALSAEQRRAIRLSISGNETSSGIFTRSPLPDKRIFKLDEPIHIGILITNTARESVRVYDSNPWYQNRPQLTRDGNAVAYSENIRELIRQSDSGMLCEFTGLPHIVELKPDVPLRVESIKLQEWYGPLSRGHYKLFLKRTFACCAEEPWNTTNEITFDVTP
jgi:hypothetical protein